MLSVNAIDRPLLYSHRGEPIWPTKFRALDLFAGCGGFSVGMALAGWAVVGAVEWDEGAAQTYLLNNGRRDVTVEARSEAIAAKLRALSGTNEKRSWPADCEWFWCRDIRDLTGDRVRVAIGHVDAVIGSPPCQGMTRMNLRRHVNDPRNAMTGQFARLVSEVRPSVFVMENVPDLMTIGDGQLYDAFEDRMCAEGYTVCANILDAANYGVPQRRRRTVVIGSLHGRYISVPTPATWQRIRRAGDQAPIRSPEGEDRPQRNQAMAVHRQGQLFGSEGQ